MRPFNSIFAKVAILLDTVPSDQEADGESRHSITMATDLISGTLADFVGLA